MTHLVPRNWTRHQSYKFGSPNFIKLHTRLMVDDDYLNLTATQRAALHGFWLIYAMSGKSVPLDVEKINRKLALRTKMETWKELIAAGFLEEVDENEPTE
ncbi:MAG: hypothetical protein ABUS54_10270 [Actinomycetota bacterium]